VISTHIFAKSGMFYGEKESLISFQGGENKGGGGFRSHRKEIYTVLGESEMIIQYVYTGKRDPPLQRKRKGRRGLDHHYLVSPRRRTRTLSLSKPRKGPY